MKKKIFFVFFSCLFAFMLTSCGKILSVVTVDDDGEKVITNYISVIGNEVYDASSSFSSWKELQNDYFDVKKLYQENLLFCIENKKENIVVFGDEERACEIKFFDGGYKYELYACAGNSSGSLGDAADSSFDSIDRL